MNIVICLLSQKPESIEAFKNSGRILMDDEMERVLKSLRTSDKQYSEVMICGNGGYMVGRLIVDAYAIALYSSKAEDFNKIQELNRKGYAEALDKILGNDDSLTVSQESKDFIIKYLQKAEQEIYSNPYMARDKPKVRDDVSKRIQEIVSSLQNEP